MQLNPKVTDAALFHYPDFVAKSQTLTVAGKGLSLTPRNSKPGSSVENIVMTKSTAQNVVEAIDCAMATLDRDHRMIIEVKYAWHYEGDRLIVSEPLPMKLVYQQLLKQGYRWSDRTMYDDLAEIRDRVGRYLDSLGSELLAGFGMMPKRKRTRKVTDEEFGVAVDYLKARKVEFVEKKEEEEKIPT